MGFGVYRTGERPRAFENQCQIIISTPSPAPRPAGNRARNDAGETNRFWPARGWRYARRAGSRHAPFSRQKPGISSTEYRKHDINGAY